MESQKLLFYFILCITLGELSDFVLSLPAGLVFREDEIVPRSLISFPENRDTNSNPTRSNPCSAKGKQFRLHQKSRQCFEIYTRGPCGDNMMFYPAEKEGNIKGECKCKRTDEDNPIPLIYHDVTDRCFSLYKQGYCKEHEWLVYSETGIPKCQPNPCKDSEVENVVLFKGQCVKILEAHPMCSTLYPVVGFGPEDLEPVCTYEIADQILVPKGNSTCKPGFKFVGSRCRKVSTN